MKIKQNSFAMPVKKGFPYKNLINHQLEKMMESGVLDQIKKRHLSPLSKTQSYICSAVQVLTSLFLQHICSFSGETLPLLCSLIV